MTRTGQIAVLSAILFLAAMATACAAALRVEPVLLDLDAPTAAATLTLRNDETTEVAAQTRVFRWVQRNGTETLEPTEDVVASPPIVRIPAHADYTVRIVRTSTQPVVGEESYRVIIDQLPSPQQRAQRAVQLLIRHSVPVFFRAPGLAPAQVSWVLTSEAGRFAITATNNGDERLRIAALRLRDGAGSTIDFGNGLIGYVLGRSSMTFFVDKPPRGFGTGAVQVTAASNKGPVHATVALQMRR